MLRTVICPRSGPYAQKIRPAAGFEQQIIGKIRDILRKLGQELFVLRTVFIQKRAGIGRIDHRLQQAGILVKLNQFMVPLHQDASVAHQCFQPRQQAEILEKDGSSVQIIPQEDNAALSEIIVFRR